MSRFINSSILSSVRRILIYTSMLLLFSIAVNAREVTLQWDPNSEPDLSHYVVYWGENSGEYSNNSGDIGLVTTYSAILPDDGQIYYFAVTAVDEAGLESDYSNEVNTEGVSSNTGPLAAAGPDQNVNEGSLVYLDASNSNDPDGEIVSYQWVQAGGIDVALNDPAAMQPSFYAPSISSDGESLTFLLTVTDDEGLQSTDTCIVNIVSVNIPPAANAGPDQNVNEGSLVYLDGTNSSDPDGDSLTYQWLQTGGPSVILDDSTLVQPIFDSPYIDSEGESLTFQLTVTDEHGLQSTDSCIVNIISVNNPPSANAGPDQNVNEGSVVHLSGANSSDPDGDPLTYQWTQTGGRAVSLDDSGAVQTLFNSPYIESDGESLTFQLTVTDKAGLQSTDTCIVNIVSVNNPPSASAGPDQTVEEGAAVTLNGSGSTDPDGDVLSFKWVQIGGTSVTLSSSIAANPVFETFLVDPEGESLTFQLTVTDADGLQSKDTCIVNITWVNDPPVASAGPDQNVDEGSSVTLNGSGSTDPDGDSVVYNWTQVSGPAVTFSGSNVANPTFAIPYIESDGESMTFQLTVTDAGGLQSTDTCVVNIVSVNNPPEANAGADQNVDEGSSVTLNGFGSSDPDGDVLAYKWTQISGPVVTLTSAGSVQAGFMAPDVDKEGATAVFQLTVTDESGLQATDTCMVNIQSVNNPPEASAGADQTIDEGVSASLSGSGSSDPDGDVLVYKWSQVSGPVVSLTNAGSAQAGFKAPDVDKDGTTLVFKLTVTDEGGLESTDTCAVNISWVNEAPVADAGPDQTFSEGLSVTLNGSGSSDPDGNTLSYRWVQIGGPAVILNNSASIQPAFITPDVGMEGDAVVFRLTVTDQGGLESTDTCVVNVSWVNEAPTANAGSDQTVNEGSVITLNGSGSSDPDGSSLTFKWIQVSGPAVSLSNSGSAITSFTSPDVNAIGDFITFQLTVTDPEGLQATDRCIINILSVNAAPAADAGPDQTVNEGSSVTLNGSGSSDPDGDSLTYRWTQVSGIAVNLNNSTSALATFTSPDIDQDETVVFQLTVKDEGGLESTDRCTVNISMVNEAPTANAGSDQTVSEGTLVTLNGSGSSDPEGDTLSYEWIQVSGPHVTISGAASAAPSFNAQSYIPGDNSLIFQLTVADAGGLKSTDQCSVTVTGTNNSDLTGYWNSVIKYWSWTERTYVLNGSFTVRNNGGTVDKPFRVCFYLSRDSQLSSDDVLIFDQSIASVGADGAVNISLDQIKSSYLTKFNNVICKIDDGNAIPETNEDNNSIATGINVNYWSFFWR